MFTKTDHESFPPTPTEIDWWRCYLLKGCSRTDHHKPHKSLRSNLGYSLQYLEFLNFQCSDKSLHYTVQTLTLKTFVITSMSVIEGLAFYLLTINGLRKMKKWEIVAEWVSNHKKIGKDDTRVRTVLERRISPPLPDDMTLDSMIKKLEKSELVNISTDDYKTLSYLRKLRNKVHVYDVSHYLDTDWHSFSRKHYNDCKMVLGSILKSDVFNPTSEDLAKLKWLDVS